jgi:hypothetical protein
MKKFGKIVLEGASGASYPFKVYPWQADFKPEGGVFVVTKRKQLKGGRRAHSRIFAGQTANLSTRVAECRDTKAFQGHEANCICVHTEPAEKKRVAIETDLLSKFRPPCNK